MFDVLKMSAASSENLKKNEKMLHDGAKQPGKSILVNRHVLPEDDDDLELSGKLNKTAVENSRFEVLK